MSDTKYSIIEVSGDDALGFLQAQLTNDLRRLDTETEIPAAWCSPKGRVIWFGTVRRSESGYTMSVTPDMAEEIVQGLTRFRFRSRVQFAIQEGGKFIPAKLLRDGIVQVGRAQQGKFTPHMLNLDLVDAVSFDKGCYPGQEIVARTHYRGATKRRCLRFESTGPVSAGDKVSDGARDVGEVVNVVGKELLAVVPVDGDKTAFSVNGSPLLHLPLPYLE
jgi:folate-binding protein YgfZ